jgi:RNA polymerase sigma factor (sigma-70 family)
MIDPERQNGKGHDDATPMPDVDLDVMLSRHLPALRNYVRGRVDRLVAAKESSADLVQSVCREVIEHIDRFEHRSEAGFRQWLYRTAERKIIDRFRYYTADKRDAGRETRSDDLPDGGAIHDTRGLFYTPSHDAMVREELHAATSAFDALPEHYRQVIILSRMQGMTHAHIAERIGRSEGAVRNLLYRGLAAISDALDTAEDNDPNSKG